MQIMTFEAKEENGDVLLLLPPSDALDAVLGTSKWMIRKAEEESQAIATGTSGVSIAGPTPAVEKEAKDDKLRAAGIDTAGPEKAAASGCGEKSLEW